MVQSWATPSQTFSVGNLAVPGKHAPYHPQDPADLGPRTSLWNYAFEPAFACWTESGRTLVTGEGPVPVLDCCVSSMLEGQSPVSLLVHWVGSGCSESIRGTTATWANRWR